MEHTSHLLDKPALVLERSVFKFVFFFFLNMAENTINSTEITVWILWKRAKIENLLCTQKVKKKKIKNYMFKPSNQWIYTFISSQIWRVQVNIRGEEWEKVNQDRQECKMTLFPAASTLWKVIVLFVLGGDLRSGRERMDVLLQSL